MTSQKEPSPVTHPVTHAVEWIGYLEHRTPENLGVFTENAGKGGETVFAWMLRRSQGVEVSGLPWCAVFVHAVVDRPDLLGKASPGVRTLLRRMIWRGLWRGRRYVPRPGDIIFCSNTRTAIADHCGIVEHCDGAAVVSIDGNTVDPSGTFATNEGGAVARRSRRLDDPVIVGYGAISKRL